MMKLIIAIAFFVAATEAIVCPPNACLTVRCASATPCNGRFVQGGGYCGCCDACLTQLGEGQSCFSSLLLGMPSTVECEPGLHCDRASFKCVKDTADAASPTTPPCKDELNTYLLGQQNAQPLLGARKPECDSNGYYAPKQCSGSQCYCVRKDGSQIDGYTANVWEASGMTCQCARDQAEYMATGLIGKLFYCTNDGSYQNYKCVGSVCFCADSNGNQLGTATVHIGKVDTLNC